MPIFKEVNESYFGPQTLRNVLNYVLRGGDVGGLAVDPAHAHEQMLLVKQIWNKLGGRQIRHFIVSFAPHEFLLPDDARTYAYQIARYYSAHYQIVFGVHHDTKNLHLHFAFNTVSYQDGKMYSGGRGDYYSLINHIQSCMPQWTIKAAT